MNHDVIVIGGGAGGLAAARAVARRGAHPLLVQQGPLGGECTFTGCVPSKTLIEAAARGAPFPAAMAAVRDAVAAIAATETAPRRPQRAAPPLVTTRRVRRGGIARQETPYLGYLASPDLQAPGLVTL